MSLQSHDGRSERSSDVGTDPLDKPPSGYAIGERVHAGSRSVLYRAVRQSDGIGVVLKSSRSPRPTARELSEFRHEHEVLSRLSGKAVIATGGLETHAGRPWLVLDDVGGKPLDRVAHRFRDPERALRLAARIAEALDEVHRAGVVHGDIKPEHVIVLDDGTVRLTGFRIASLLRVTSASTTRGTFAYMAPEQTGRMNRPVDKRADLYSLGVLLYELLTGQRPFEARDPLEWIHAHIAKVPAPPETVDERVPLAASAIVLRLLSKHAEDRYHGASGVQRDLERCAEDVARGAAAPFPLATRDAPDDFHVSHRLYGREVEVSQLIAGFERARTGDSCVVSLVGGYSGVGKTSVVFALYQPIVRERGRFVGGKFDQYKRDIPYATIVQAFRELVRDVLAAGDAVLAEWRARLTDALGVNGRVLADVVPELGLVIGAQPEVPELAPAEAQNRFEAVLLSFVRVFSRRDHPLVIFLDDLQWADAATLGVLRLLARPGELPCLQLVLAYRDNEVDAAHPFQLCVDAMRASGARADHITVRDLGDEDVRRLVADTLMRGTDDPEVASLATLVRNKAGGNPFFVNELLHAFEARGLFVFDRDRGFWTWDESAMRAADVTDNVVDLLVERLRKLPDRTQQALEVASCFGSRFQVGALSAVMSIGVDDMAAVLFAALEDGMLVAVDDEIGGERTYRFHHDRVQQAAYSLVLQPDRAAIHLRIGQYLRGVLDAGNDQVLFDVVKHLDHASSLLNEPEERWALVALNLMAARRAKAAIAWEPARLYLESAVALMPPYAWATHYRVTFDVMRELAECEFLTGNFARADERFEEIRRRTQSRADRALIATLHVRLRVLTSKYDSALSLGISELAFFGESFPERDEALPGAIAAERTRLASHLEGRDVRFIVDLPLATDEEKRALIALVASLAPAIYSRKPALFPVLAMRAVNLSLEHGNCESSCFVYSMVALLFAAADGDADRAYALSEASIALNQRFADPKLLGSVLHIHANHIVYWKRPYADASAILERAYAACMEVGDLTVAAYVTFMGAWLSIERGQPLAASDEQLAAIEGLARGTRHVTAQATVAIQRQFVRALMGETTATTSLSSDAFDADSARERLAEAGFDTGVVMHDVLRAMLAFYEGHFTEADGWLARAAQRLPSAFCLPIETTWSFFDGLTAAALFATAAEDARSGLRVRLERAEAQLHAAAKSCPSNFDSKHSLIVAERARVEGRTSDAVVGYEEAARAAREAGLLSVEALVAQAAMRFSVDSRLDRASRGWLREYEGVLHQWGAAGLLRTRGEQTRHSAPAETEPLAETFRGTPEHFDALAAIKLSQALSREVSVEGLTETVLRVVRENAGAERAVLLLIREGGLAIAGASGDAASSTRRGEAPALPESIVKYAERTRTAVVLADAARDQTFGRDPHIGRSGARSVLCMPIVIRAQLVGLLYLENTLVAGAFSPDRLVLLEVISTQLAISLENASLFRERESRATEAARQSARETQRVDLYRHFMQVPFPILIFRGEDHVIELANPSALAALGRTSDVIGVPLVTAMPELRDQPFVGYLDGVLRSGETFNGNAELARLPTGPGGALEDTFFTYVYAPLRGIDGAVEGILVAAFDVTQKVLAQQQTERNQALLAEAKAQLQTVVERLGTAQRAATIGIYDWHLDGSSEPYWSPELYALLGLGSSEVPASEKEWTARLVDEDRERARASFDEACAQRQETYEIEVCLKQPSGETRAVRLSNRLFYDGDRPVRLVGAAVDVEDLRRAAEADRTARTVAERHVRFNELFAGMLGHDLRNPLSAIMSGAALLTRPNFPPAKVAATGTRITSSGRRMARMIDQLLDVTRIRTGGGIPLSLEERDLSELCERAREEIESASPGAHIVIETKGHAAGEVDEDRLLQVLSNLMGNAAVHGEQGSPVSVIVDGRSEADIVVIIRNSGTIAAELLPELFVPFRGNKTKGSKGLGLGLYITQQIVHAHRGSIDARSSPEGGTLFMMRLPRKHGGRGGMVDV